MKKIVLSALLVSFVLPVLFRASAQDEARKRRVVTMTRLQAYFGDLERGWLKSVQQKDQTALKNVLWDQFSVWTANPPGDPLPREEWVRQALARKLQSFRIDQLAVRSVTLDVAVASFVLTEAFDEGGQSKTEQHYVVDVWHDQGNNQWRCTDRYSSDVTGILPIPTQPDKKPTGKE